MLGQQNSSHLRRQSDSPGTGDFSYQSQIMNYIFFLPWFLPSLEGGEDEKKRFLCPGFLLTKRTPLSLPWLNSDVGHSIIVARGVVEIENLGCSPAVLLWWSTRDVRAALGVRVRRLSLSCIHYRRPVLQKMRVKNYACVSTGHFEYLFF